MYSPQIKPELVRVLYRLKIHYQKPITVIIDSILRNNFSTVDRIAVCDSCMRNEINDCENCLIAGEET